ncbi:hypothetical protein BDZ91DRAFT_790912 [Kalaharituber pfeilii]|nr:hypothetical protein BDZ91DRAFT_790912 [Kalaharituber pfeilii]
MSKMGKIAEAERAINWLETAKQLTSLLKVWEQRSFETRALKPQTVGIWETDWVYSGDWTKYLGKKGEEWETSGVGYEWIVHLGWESRTGEAKFEGERILLGKSISGLEMVELEATKHDEEVPECTKAYVKPYRILKYETRGLKVVSADVHEGMWQPLHVPGH